jgi:hypothetical protein
VVDCLELLNGMAMGGGDVGLVKLLPSSLFTDVETPKAV